MTKNKRYSSSQFTQRKKRQMKIKIFLWLFFTLSIIFGLSYWSGHHSVTINKIQVSENQFIDESTLINDVENLISKRYFGLFAKKNFMLLPRDEIKKSILEDNIAISEVNLELQGPNTLFIEIVEHKPKSKWCGFRSDAELDNCYLVNGAGLIYSADDMFDPYDLIRLFGVFESEENIIGQKYTETETYQNLINFVEGLREMEITTVFVETLDDETYTVQTLDGPHLLISTYNEFDQTLDNLETVVDSEDINPAQFKNLEYIDLRFGNRVYYQIR